MTKRTALTSKSGGCHCASRWRERPLTLRHDIYRVLGRSLYGHVMKLGGPWLVAAAALSLVAVHTSFGTSTVKVATDADAPKRRCAAVDRNPASTNDEIFSCRLAREESDRLLSRRATNSKGDPVLEARHAADAGDFRLMGYSMLVPGIFPAAYGIACKPSIVSQGSRMVRALYLASDVPPTSEAEAANRREVEKRYRRFGETYNATLIADIRSPFRKTCRRVTPALETEGGPRRRK